MNKNKLSALVTLCISLYNINVSYAVTAPNTGEEKNPVQQRILQETPQKDTYFLLSAYKPNYLLPFYYNSSPYYSNSASPNNPMNRNNLKHEEAKFQFSFKIPLWNHIFQRNNTLYMAYTQQSFWQAYTHSPFFRETNYEPELFLANNFNIRLSDQWHVNFINLGLTHQSNGRGGDLERSWNRAYLEAIVSNTNWMVSIKPWVAFRDSSIKDHNSDITHYMGHDRVLIAYQHGQNVFSLEKTNVESGFNRGAAQLAWSFPLFSSKFKGYIQYFNGYGQSLLEYNHRTHNIGLGFALNDWL